MSERTVHFCDGCQVEEKDIERVKAEWGMWFHPRSKRRLDFCGTCARGTEDAIVKYASVMTAHRGLNTRLDSATEDANEDTPVVDEILEKRERTLPMPRDAPVLTKHDRARIAAYKAANVDSSEPSDGHLQQESPSHPLTRK
jgi:hypothetical protein